MDVIELHNPTAETVDIGGWFLSDDFNAPRKQIDAIQAFLKNRKSPYMDKVILWHAMERKVDVRVFGGPCGGSYGSKMMSCGGKPTCRVRMS